MTRPQAAGMPACEPATFRHVVGHLASGVAVVTTQTPAGDFGATVSSVTSLSLDPPTMLACLNRSSSTCAAVAKAGGYVVNILGQGQGHLAQQFASSGEVKFVGVRVAAGVLGLPVLSEALARIECQVVEEVNAATHTIFLGRVVSAEAADGSPLTYFRGDFGRFEFAGDDAVYQRARRQILDRTFPAEAVLQIDDFAYSLDVAKSAAFYALTRLSADGLVRRDPHRGYVVVPFTTRTSDETFDARCAIELGVIDLAVGRVPEGELAELRRRFEVVAALLVGERFIDFDGYLNANYAFHECLVSLAHSAPLTTAFAQLHLKTVMTRSFGATQMTSQNFIEAQREITVGIEQEDSASARAAVYRYTDLAKERVREILELTGGRL